MGGSFWRLVFGFCRGLSPDFYCIYIDDLICILMTLNVGCHIKGIFIAALLYADDMALAAPSLKGLQALLGACDTYCVEWDICLNASKSKNMYFGKRVANLCFLVLNGNKLDSVDSWVYLGIALVSGKFFSCSVSDRIKKFYKYANSISRVEGRSNDLTMLRLMEAHCVPVLTYGLEIIHVDNCAKQKCV